MERVVGIIFSTDLDSIRTTVECYAIRDRLTDLFSASIAFYNNSHHEFLPVNKTLPKLSYRSLVRYRCLILLRSSIGISETRASFS